MLARETPLLKGEKPLCKFLEELDKAEETYLAQDDQKIAKLENDNQSHRLTAKFFCGYSIAGMAGGMVDAFRKSERSTLSSNFRDDLLFPSLLISGFLSSWVAMGTWNAINESWKQLSVTIHHERICRLQDKMRKIDQGLVNKPSDIDIEQAHRVRDYFNIKLTELINNKTIQIRVTYV
jgi:hypothetical protein